MPSPDSTIDTSASASATAAPSSSAAGSGPVDALVLLSFGGPDGPEDVMPFLENVTRGRGIPRERLEHVAEHYHHLGGKSPLNELNLEIIDHLTDALRARGRSLEVHFANRNWAPYLDDVVAELGAAGVRRAAVFATSAWGGYSGCAQYHEDIAAARRAAGESAPHLVRLGQFFSTERFVALVAAATERALATARAAGEDPRLVFTAHSIPDAADDAAGPEGDRNLYSRQVAEASALVADRVGVPAEGYDLVWQSRSGSPHVPWLEPDVVDHADDLHSRGVRSIVVCPIGFVSDHVEVVWDLDTELAEHCATLGMSLHRVATPGPTEGFAELVLDLLDEVETGREVPRLGDVSSYGCRADGARCAPDCCLRATAPTR